MPQRFRDPGLALVTLSAGDAYLREEMLEPSEIDELMGRLADGDRDAFSPLFRALWTPALRVCERMVPRQADAADAAQAAMMKILERASEYDKKRPALPWALGIAAWECRTVLRRQERLKESLGEPLLSDWGAGADEVEQKLLVQAAMHAMGRLSERDQETLLSTFLETEATASGATLRKRRERALDRLRDSFRRLYGFD